jgi:hypothetical protein
MPLILLPDRCPPGEEAAYIQKSVEEAAHLARLVDQWVVSDSELG